MNRKEVVEEISGFKPEYDWKADWNTN